MRNELIELLREDLGAAGYRLGEVAALLGPSAEGARQRGIFGPARRVLAEREERPLGTLIRLLLLGDTVTGRELATAVPRLGARGLAELGLVEESGTGYRAILSLNPVELEDSRSEQPLHWWIISDLDDQLRRGPARPDHVMGVGGATRSLIAQLPPGDAANCLDLGTGCGIVALHLALRGRVIATDISGRALDLARMNLRLNGVAEGTAGVELRQGSLFEPVAAERFDLIASNPPFVVTPRASAVPRYEYRDGGMSGDELAQAVVRQAPERLEAGGTLVCLANWESPWGGSGLERVRMWIEDAAVAAGPLHGWVIERDVLDPARYAETWARDGGARPGDAEFETLLTAWLRDFAERRVVSIGLGSIRVRRPAEQTGADEACTIRVEHAAEPFGKLPGGDLEAAFTAGIAAERMPEAELLGRRWIRSETVAELREHRPGEEAPRSIVLRTDRPIARTVIADPLLAAAVGACDGELALGQIVDALATLLEVDAVAVAEALIAGARELSWLGMLAAAER